jgi:3(or 17)beta-hydroxysteroid dehydrogenase
MGRVTGKVCIVTGGSSGLGRATAALLAREGATVVIADVSDEAGHGAAQAMGVEYRHHDVRAEQSWIDLITHVRERHGALHVLVNNAGIGEAAAGSTPVTTTLAQWEQVLAVNATGVFLGCRHGVPAIAASGGGAIVNMSSIAALLATPFATAYGASKAAVRQLTMSVAMYCAQARNGVRCNSVHPGQIRTPMLEGLFRDFGAAAGISAADMEAKFLAKIPLGEFGQPGDIAQAVLYLASDESRHVTGTQLVVDGGMQFQL